MFGELELRSAGRPLEVGTPRQQVVLAALVVDARRPVSIEALVDRVWDHAPPADPRSVLYSHLSRIRRLLEQAATADGPAVRIERRHAGYVLEVDPDLVDLHRFRRLVEQGDDRRRDEEVRAAGLAEALALWQGTPLACLPGEWAAQVRASWHRLRLDAVVRWAQLELRLDRPAAVITALPGLAAEYPLVEPLESLLMRALYAAGRGAEALARYPVVRRRLADELGADPGPELRALHQAILRGRLPSAPIRNSATTSHRAVPAPVNGEPVIPPPDDDPAPPHTAEPGPLAVPAGPPGRTRSGPLRRPRVVAVLVAAVLLAAIGSLPVLQRDEVQAAPSIEHAHALFADAQRLDQDGRMADAQAKIIEAVRLHDELIKLDPDRHARPLAPAITRALGLAGIDFSVPASSLHAWLANPLHTPYPAISQALLLQGWRLKAPVFLDVVVANYEQTPGIASPRTVADVNLDVVKAAVLEGSNVRYGTQVTDFGLLLKPR
ncbi:AfsR/SARP family transcriptional regulator [Actinosynnema sp. CS-041913]|uniref:AfsR/SARP family transcriptional regulator n=1 Tax=Actinosynnema sp. CS-041913 TaxID=3239917 RepID=UPI003D8B0369